MRRFHIFFEIGGSFLLVGRILVNERCLQLGLQITIARKSVAGLRLAFSVKLYQVAGYVFNFFFCGFLQALPGIGTEFIHPRYSAFFAAVLAYAVKRVDVYVQQVVIGIQQAYHLLHFTVYLYLLQTIVFAYAVVYVGNVIAGFKLA